MRRVLRAPLTLLLVALAAFPAAATPAGHTATRVGRDVRAHEEARARVEELRESDAPPGEVRDAERHRRDVRSRLWDLLWAVEHALADPVAVDPAGRAGHCPFGPRSTPAQVQAPAPSPFPGEGTSWTVPTTGYRLTAGYAERGRRWKHRHTGQDFAVGSGTPVRAVGPGTVRVTTCGDGFGNQVLVRHRDGYFTQYAHLSRIDVRKGQKVRAGQLLGLSGATGNVTGPHLHFEVRITPYIGSAVPPLPWLARKGVHPEQ
ncbi:M23 family metallopeptidase [Streptomyces longwoodensis]|uniref:M23 family metallopeptidase n=1 Tax=Streptomyces longwoodensis TaxID=68231 RepID=UPI002DD9BA6D|nr:M23 family metallopeptidase [Streptomyces longwoodensis]WRY89707.1 M23 family metallopeptidase [Streptomyces longwoodensis]